MAGVEVVDYWVKWNKRKRGFILVEVFEGCGSQRRIGRPELSTSPDYTLVIVKENPWPSCGLLEGE
jgi:hypothetical protein